MFVKQKSNGSKEKRQKRFSIEVNEDNEGKREECSREGAKLAKRANNSNPSRQQGLAKSRVLTSALS
jgi:hypothetical protein